MRQAAEYFVRAVREYDPMLRVRWSDRAQQFAVERKAHATERGIMEQLKAIYYNRARRPIRDDLPIEKQRFMLERRKRAHLELESAKLHCRFLFLVPDTTVFFLQCVIYTLRETDEWNHPGIKDEGFHASRVDQAATRIAQDGAWDETYGNRRRAAGHSRDNRDRAKEAFAMAQFVDGCTSAAPIRHSRRIADGDGG